VSILIVVDNPKTWPLFIPGVPLVSARSYLTEPRFYELERAKVFNLCRSYRYQSLGYYVSLLAMARHHKALPSITTIQDMRTLSIVRLASDDLEDVIRRDLKGVQTPEFTLSIYFGRNLAKRYDDLAGRLFRLFAAPLLRAEFSRGDGDWRLTSIRPIAASDIPEAHHAFVVEAAMEFFAQRRFPKGARSNSQYDLAILHNPADPNPPSNALAIRKFAQAAKRLHLDVELIGREDFGRLSEFDALFIRDTTSVNHYTYRFARRAAAEGLVVVDDPESITKCGNKVYLAELLERHHVPTPRTRILHRDNHEQVFREIGLPCILKKPDSYFSQGVVKVNTKEELVQQTERLLESSDLILAQEFLPTDFDWRVAVLDHQPLFVCKYFMADRHWQIIRNGGAGEADCGKVEAVPIEHAPRAVISTALRAARLIGDGLYGVDLKQSGKRVYVIEINDNPNIDAGYEDRILRDELYERVLRVFLTRIQQRKERNWAY
jgi:glutathione synthase/RimK-type ligase-like ATP-grasp enzyme